MDPNETLRQLREKIAEARQWEANPYHEETSGEEVYQLFDDLDDWLSKGGILPKDWQWTTWQWTTDDRRMQ